MNLKKIVAALALTFLVVGCSSGISEIEAKNLAETFINENLLSGGITASVLDAVPESGFWKLTIELSDGREVNSLISQDGKIFVPEAIYIEEIEAAAVQEASAAEEAQANLLATLEKTERPIIELFVMSHCPYGTQAEKAILPALDVLGDSVDFQLKFVNYVMHGEPEVLEQRQQFAISSQFPDKLIPYLQEFLAAGDSVAALAAVGLTEADLADTIAAVDSEFEITKNLEDESLWLSGRFPLFNTHTTEVEKYGVQGSPAFVVNGKLIEGVARTPAGMLGAICAAFENAPESCSAELSTATPSAGFGFEGEGSGSGECS